jgi:hypothetical protein
MRRIRGLAKTVVAIAGVVSLSAPIGASAAEGVSQGESTQQKGQQGVGLDKRGQEQGSGGPQSSNVIMGGPEIVTGRISKIDGEQYSITGDRGQEIRLKVTKDTNMVCGRSQKDTLSTGREGVKEHEEIPPTRFMEQQAGKGGGPESKPASTEQQMAQQHRQQDSQKAEGAPAKDPSQLKGKVGSTDAQAHEDVARGSGFSVGECQFHVGDAVRVEASDMGTATTIKQLARERTSDEGEGTRHQ